jgi:hypothetical protein
MYDLRSPAADAMVLEADKLVRMTTLARVMLEEARSAPCDPPGCERLRRIYEKTLSEVGRLLPEPLRTELVFLSVTFDEVSPSPSEIRAAQAELVGWLEGLLDGIVAWSIGAGGPGAGVDPSGLALADGRPLPGQYL